MFCCISSELNICSFWDVSTQSFATLFSRFSGLNFFQWSSREVELLQWLPRGSHQSAGEHGLSQSPTLDCSAKCRFPVLLKDPKRRGGGPVHLKSLRKLAVGLRKTRRKSETWEGKVRTGMLVKKPRSEPCRSQPQRGQTFQKENSWRRSEKGWSLFPFPGELWAHWGSTLQGMC